MNIKVILSIIENNRCLRDEKYFWGLNIFSIQNRSTISGFVPPHRQLILYPFQGCLSIHHYQFGCVRKQKQMKFISLNDFTGHIKKVIFVFHSNGNSFDIFITIIQPKILKWSNGFLKWICFHCFYFNLTSKYLLSGHNSKKYIFLLTRFQKQSYIL